MSSKSRKAVDAHPQPTAVSDSSGDVFADLGVVVDEQERLKLEIAIAISGIIERTGKTQSEVAAIIGADQGKVSNLVRGRLKGFSVDRLMQYLLRLGYDIDVHITRRKARSKGSGEVRVHRALAA